MNELNQAIVLYVGWNLSSYPSEDESRLLEHFGEVKGMELAKRVRSILEDLKQTQPDWNSQDLAEAAKWAVGKVAARHWLLDRQAKAALEWTFSWWWK